MNCSLNSMDEAAGAVLRATLGVVLTGLALSVADPLRAQERHTLSEVSFLSGCWAGQMGPLDMEEQWTEAAGGAMLGTTRYLRGGVVVDWEFGRIVEDEQGVTLWPYPKGVLSEHDFPLVTAGVDGEYVFENLAHDFPVRIIYARESDDVLKPRIEGADGNGPGWSLRRVDCPTGAR